MRRNGPPPLYPHVPLGGAETATLHHPPSSAMDAMLNYPRCPSRTKKRPKPDIPVRREGLLASARNRIAPPGWNCAGSTQTVSQAVEFARHCLHEKYRWLTNLPLKPLPQSLHRVVVMLRRFNSVTTLRHGIYGRFAQPKSGNHQSVYQSDHHLTPPPCQYL